MELTPEERTRLKEIAGRVRASTPSVSFGGEEVEDDDTWPGHLVYLFRLPTGRIIGNMNKDFASDGELFAASRDDLALLLRLVAREVGRSDPTDA